jgi:threonine dehydrogenase-like Zn-dependent dehydrogenase
VVYEVTARDDGIAAAMELLDPRGRLVAVGMGKDPVPTDIRRLTLREIAMVGTMALVFAADVPEAVRILSEREGGWGDVAPLALPLEDLVDEALIPMSEGRSERIKTLLDPWADEARPTLT